jgi:multidrug efflux system membrane fusion protein
LHSPQATPRRRIRIRGRAEKHLPEMNDPKPDTRTQPHIGPERQLPAPRASHAWILWVGLLLLIAVVAYFIIHNRDQKQAAAKAAKNAPKPSVTTTFATAQKGNIGVYLEAIGTVTPVYTATITAQASGVLTDVHYKEGQLVHKGDALIDIDPRPYEAQLEEAQGTLKKDTNVLAQAQMDLDRYKAAWEKNGIPRQQLEDQEKIVLQDQGTVENDQGIVHYDQVQLSYCHIASPITGRTGLRLVDPGNVVQANGTNPLVVVTQVQPITVIFTLAEDSLGQVQARMRKMHTLPVEAMDRGQTKVIAKGKLFTIDNQIDTTTGTVKLRAQFDNKDGALFPNQFVNTRLLVNTENDVTLVPTNAIQHNGQVSFVYVLANGAASVRNVKTGTADSGQTAVEGVNPGELVATSSFEKLQANSKVVLSKQAQPANPVESNTP